jgi:hypothetical protein
MTVVGPFSNEQARILVNLRQGYEVWIEALDFVAVPPKAAFAEPINLYEVTSVNCLPCLEADRSGRFIPRHRHAHPDFAVNRTANAHATSIAKTRLTSRSDHRFEGVIFASMAKTRPSGLKSVEMVPLK